MHYLYTRVHPFTLFLRKLFYSYVGYSRVVVMQILSLQVLSSIDFPVLHIHFNIPVLCVFWIILFLIRYNIYLVCLWIVSKIKFGAPVQKSRTLLYIASLPSQAFPLPQYMKAYGLKTKKKKKSYMSIYLSIIYLPSTYLYTYVYTHI